MNDKEQINKENEKPDPGFNPDLHPNLLDSGFSGGWRFSARLYCIRKKA